MRRVSERRSLTCTSESCESPCSSRSLVVRSASRVLTASFGTQRRHEPWSVRLQHGLGAGMPEEGAVRSACLASPFLLTVSSYSGSP